MRLLYFDCFSGISGDMTLGALIDLGVDEGWLIRQLHNLGLSGWELYVRSVDKKGLKSIKVDVLQEERTVHTTHPDHQVHKHEHSSMEAITTVLATAGIPEPAKDLALRIFRRLSEAEAKVHKVPVNEIHLQDTSSLNAIIDIVGTALCIHQLAPQKIIASVQYDGRGFAECPQGLVPLPLPVVTELFTSRNVPFHQHAFIDGKLTTPTGAAIISELAESFGVVPSMQLMGVGYGAGDKDYALPNILRVVLGETIPEAKEGEEEKQWTVLEASIDNVTPEVFGLVLERLFSSGATEIYFVPRYIKKGHPTTFLSVLCEECAVTVLERIIFTETATLGIRRQWIQRQTVNCKDLLVQSPFGHLKAKEVTVEGKLRAAIDYKDARRLSIETGTPLRKILSFSSGEILHIETT
jgi:uncharacterized protein (TIGR00299 family) protein